MARKKIIKSESLSSKDSCHNVPRIRPQPGIAATNSDHVIGAAANADDSISSREKAVQLREGSSALSEKANRAREDSMNIREDVSHGREAKVLLREDSVTGREQQLSMVLKKQEAQDELHAKLRQANEHLVMSSLESQIANDETEKTQAALTHLANHDFLTNLPNRMQLYERINLAIAFAKRHNTKLAVLFLDLDRFKKINDTLGHAIGDQLLQSVAQRLKSGIRSTDTVSRQGGDEFVLILSEAGVKKPLARNIEKLHKLVTAPYSIAGHDLNIGATIGISIFPEDGEDTETLIRNADMAMYYAKKSGRNKFKFFRQEMRVRDETRHIIEASLYEALSKKQFVLFYQAQINLESGLITGAEALIRWQHPSRGLLLPEQFISIAEESGAIREIGHWVLNEACRQAKSWLDAGLAFNVIAVNISASEFENEDLLENICDILKKTGLAPHHLELEITETVLMKSVENAALTLHALRAMGVKISIDDFGTGYSSLSYLKSFPADTMKIDQSFIHDISGDDIIIKAIISIGKGLHHQVVAEGVETPKQLAFLQQNNCPVVQGFYLSRPMTARKFSKFLKQGVPENILG